jgi:hypothetical protein
MGDAEALRPRRSRRGIAAGAARVAGAVALLALVYAGVVVPWQRRWGATAAEVGRGMPGDRIVRAAGGAPCSTVAVTVDAPPERVWPWLLQMGVGRGGFYTHAWVEDLLGLGVTNADRIVPEWQHLKVGDVVGIRSREEGARVAELDPGRSLVLADEPTPGYVSTWDFGLYPLERGRTRLVLRRGAAGLGAIGRALNTLLEPGFYVMDRGMLMGIKRRAETGAP